jgi:hypothetical protein
MKSFIDVDGIDGAFRLPYDAINALKLQIQDVGPSIAARDVWPWATGATFGRRGQLYCILPLNKLLACGWRDQIGGHASTLC